jgi:hypothetical protein
MKQMQVFLESVLLEIRVGDLDRASEAAHTALTIHTGAGRLWAVQVQLKQRENNIAQQVNNSTQIDNIMLISGLFLRNTLH